MVLRLSYHSSVNSGVFKIMLAISAPNLGQLETTALEILAN